MKRHYSFSIFLLLGLLVIVAIGLSYAMVKSPKTPLSEALVTSHLDDTTNRLPIHYTKDSWLGQINKNAHQKSFQYAVTEIQVKLN